MHFDVSELRELAADLGKVGPKTTALASKVVAKVAHDIEAAAQIAAPVDTGALRNSISSTVEALSAEVGPTVEHGIYVEYGTSRMRPQPFMGPAFDANIGKLEQALGQIGGKIL